MSTTPSLSQELAGHRHPPRPVVAACAGVISGLLITLGGAIEVARVPGAYATTLISLPAFVPTWALGVVGLVSGVAVLGASWDLVRSPDRHIGLGAMLLIASVISSISLSGFAVGLVLGVVAGIAALVWVPVRGSLDAPGPRSDRQIERSDVPQIPSSVAGEETVFWNRSYEPKPAQAPPQQSDEQSR